MNSSTINISTLLGWNVQQPYSWCIKTQIYLRTQVLTMNLTLNLLFQNSQLNCLTLIGMRGNIFTPCPFWIRFCQLKFYKNVQTFSEVKKTSIGLIWHPTKLIESYKTLEIKTFCLVLEFEMSFQQWPRRLLGPTFCNWGHSSNLIGPAKGLLKLLRNFD